MTNGNSVGLAFQGGCFFAGAISAGVVRALVDRKRFDNINAFSGTSAGALVAAMCWGHKLQGTTPDLPADLRRQWLENANGLIPTEEWGIFYKLLDQWMLLNPLYFWWKEKFYIPYMQKEFEDWLVKYVEPKNCMQALFTKYVEPAVKSAGSSWLEEARKQYEQAEAKPHLAVGTSEIHTGEVVTIDDEDLFEALLDAFRTALGTGNVIGNEAAVKAAEEKAVNVAARYMTMALMTSGSLDTINGMTRIDEIEGISNEDLLHKGEYLDGAYGNNPPIAPLTNCDIDEIWTVEIFPKRCDAELSSNEKREDRKEELLQNAPVEHQYNFINNLNFWIASGRMKQPTPSEMSSFEERWETDADWRAKVIDAFCGTIPHPERYADIEQFKKAIGKKLMKKYDMIRTRTISLPPDLQPLTDGARIVNSPAFLIDKMNRGYQNTLSFLDQVH
jgi:predicted acylesterase/phospholipase RssA